jgi:hypothetical protein
VCERETEGERRERARKSERGERRETDRREEETESATGEGKRQIGPERRE